jgi:hypothetical protein
MRKNIAARLALIPAFVLASTGAAHAALPTVVADAIASAGADMTTAITSIITAFVVFWGLKKLGGKLGWI